MSSDDLQQTFVISEGNQDRQLTLADLGAFNLDDVERFRMTAYKFPVGLYDWSIKLIEQRLIANKLCWFCAQECEYVHECADEKVDRAELIGKEHVEMFFMPVAEGKKPTLEDMSKFLGLLKDYLLSVHATASGSVGEVLQIVIGHKFRGPIIHQPDRVKPGNYYSKLDLDKITPVEGTAPETQAA